MGRDGKVWDNVGDLFHIGKFMPYRVELIPIAPQKIKRWQIIVESEEDLKKFSVDKIRTNLFFGGARKIVSIEPL